jgi:hypothetical protein
VPRIVALIILIVLALPLRPELLRPRQESPTRPRLLVDRDGNHISDDFDARLATARPGIASA